MKKTITLLALVFSIVAFAQVPQGISYQAIALNSSGNPVVSSNIGIRLSVLDNSATGIVLYTETHSKTTNAQGLFNLVIGQGTPSTGTFSTINWGTNSKFLKVEMDVTSGTNYALVGTTQLLSVPYALQAGKVNSEDVVGAPDLEFAFTDFYSSSFITETNAYIYEADIYNSNPSTYSWHSTPITGTPLMKSTHGFLTTTNAYLFGPTSPNANSPSGWLTFQITGIPYSIENTLVVTSTNAYFGFEQIPVNISGNIADTLSGITGCGVLTSTNAYCYSFTNGWQSIAIAGNPLKVKYTPDGILFLTTTNAYLYGKDTIINSQPSWRTIDLTSPPVLD